MAEPVYLPDGDANAWRLFRERTARGEDLISSLPDKLIGHIFSFLLMKDIVKTILLSKRWYRCWMQTPSICINGQEREFRNGIDRILTILEPSDLTIDKFCLRSLPVSTEPNDMDRYDDWVKFAIRHRVKELFVELSKGLEGDDSVEIYHLPEELLECRTMVKLHMTRCDFPYMFVEDELNVHWDSLRLFSILDVELVEDIMDRVLRGCPVLERLVLIACFSTERIEIRSGELRELFISGYSNGDSSRRNDVRFRYYKDYNKYKYEDEEDKEDEEDCDNALRISTPHLRSLRLFGTWRSKTMILLRGVLSLIEVHLDLRNSEGKDLQDVVRYIVNRILGDLCLVQKLIIGRYSLQVLLTSKLRGGNWLFGCWYLSMKESADEMGFLRIVEILKYTPSLQKLVLDLTPNITHKDNLVRDSFDTNIRNTEKMNCLAGSLVRVEIIGFGANHRDGSNYLLVLVEFLLKNSLKLEKMVLHSTKSWEESNYEMFRKLIANVRVFQRGSEAAQVVLRSAFDRADTVIAPQPPCHNLNPTTFEVVPFPVVYERRHKRRQGNERES